MKSFSWAKPCLCFSHWGPRTPTCSDIHKKLLPLKEDWGIWICELGLEASLWQAGRHWGRWAQQGQSLPERVPVLSLEAHILAFLSLLVLDTLGWVAPLGFASLCVLGLLAASPSLPLPCLGRERCHTHFRPTLCGISSSTASPPPPLSFPSFLYLENLLAEVLALLEASPHDHQPQLLPGAEF